MYTEQRELQLTVLTWNCAGKAPPPNFDINNQLYTDYANLSPQQMSDIVVVGLQEMVELNTKELVKDGAYEAVREAALEIASHTEEEVLNVVRKI